MRPGVPAIENGFPKSMALAFALKREGEAEAAKEMEGICEEEAFEEEETVGIPTRDLPGEEEEADTN